jgi:single-strand DNA-binding protein
MTKGRPLYVEGRLRLDQWEDKTTKEKRSRMKVVLEQFQFLGENRGAPGTGGSSEPGIDQTASPERHSPPARSAAPKPAAQENLDEDVPF